jgi:hypothetical protein
MFTFGSSDDVKARAGKRPPRRKDGDAMTVTDALARVLRPADSMVMHSLEVDEPSEAPTSSDRGDADA